MNVSDELRRKRSEAAKKRWSDPEFKRRISEKMRRKSVVAPSLCLCGCGKLAASGNRYVHGHNSRVAHPMLGKIHTAETRKKLRESHIGKNSGADHPMYGKTHTPEARRRISDALRGVKQSPELIAKRVSGRAGYRHSEETLLKIGAGNKGKVISPEAREKISAAKKGRHCSPETEFTSALLKARYKDPEYVAKMAKAWDMKPNKAESLLQCVLDRMFPGEWKYTGDFSMTINGKCPDFVNCNGQKKIIELFGDYWHRGQNPQDRIDAFAPYGYKTLVVWERELREIKTLEARLECFSRSDK